MPGKQPRALCPVCQEALPPDETECRNCGAFVIDEAVVRLSRAFGIDREKALQLFEAGFRRPEQLRGRDVEDVIERRETGLLFLCTNCGGFAATGDSSCPRCGAEFEPEEEPAPAEGEDILDLILCPNCGADNTPEWSECEICGEPLRRAPPEVPAPVETPARPAAAKPEILEALRRPEPLPPTRPPTGAETTAPTARVPEEADRATPARAPWIPERHERPYAAVPERPEAPRPRPRDPPTQVPARPRTREIPAAPRPLEEIRREEPLPKAGRARPEETVEAPARRSVTAAPRPAAVSMKKPVGIRAARSRRPQPRIPRTGPRPAPEFAAPAVLAAAAGLFLSGQLRHDWMVWTVAFFLAGAIGYAVVATRPAGRVRLGRTDAALLLIGTALGALGPFLASLVPDLAVGFAVMGAVPLSAAARRLLETSERLLLVAAASASLLGIAGATAMDLKYATTTAGILGIGAALPWPAAVVVEDVRQRRLARAVRREIAHAESQVAHRHYPDSVESFDRAIAMAEKAGEPEDLPWYGKGATLIMMGRYEEALRAIDRALDINPHNEVAWVNKGNAYTKMGQFVDALRCFNAAIKVNPRYEVAWNNKGNALARLGRFDEALRCYERALSIDLGYRGAWVNKGYVLAKLGRYDEAAACADRVLHLQDRAEADAA